MKINIEKLKFQHEGRWFPLPVGIKKEFEEVEVIGRLTSTKGGGADWRISENLRSYLSAAPYQPYLHLKGKAYVYTDRKSGIYRYDCDDENVLVISRFAGYWGEDFLLKIIFKDEIKDPSYRKERKEFFDSLEEQKTFLEKQGHLSISKIERNFQRETLLSFPFVKENQKYRFLNHEVYKERGEGLLYAGYDWKRFVFVDITDAAVISPDHLEETIVLSPGAYILEHPRPVGGRD